MTNVSSLLKSMVSRILVLVLLALTITVVSPTSALAAAFTVTRADDRNNATCAVGDCSLREAINAANTAATDDVISFAANLTTITLTGEIQIQDNGTVVINGSGANVLTIDAGSGDNRIFSTDHATVTITDLTLTGGGGTGSFNTTDGGAIYAYASSLTLDRVHVTGNSANGSGGGVYLRGGNSHRISNSTFSANSATDCGGFANDGAMTCVGSTVSGNTAFGNGGGICTANSGSTTLHSVTIANNTANQAGGGIYRGTL